MVLQGTSCRSVNLLCVKAGGGRYPDEVGTARISIRARGEVSLQLQAEYMTATYPCVLSPNTLLANAGRAIYDREGRLQRLDADPSGAGAAP